MRNHQNTGMRWCLPRPVHFVRGENSITSGTLFHGYFFSCSLISQRFHTDTTTNMFWRVSASLAERSSSGLMSFLEICNGRLNSAALAIDHERFVGLGRHDVGLPMLPVMVDPHPSLVSLLAFHVS